MSEPTFESRDAVFDILCYDSKGNKFIVEIQVGRQAFFINMVFVRLPMFNKKLEECQTLQDKLIFSLRHAHELEFKPKEFGEGVFDKIFDIAQIVKFSIKERDIYEANMMNQRDQYAALKCAREGVTIGREGVVETARNMLGKGVEPVLVASYTNLPLEAVEALR